MKKNPIAILNHPSIRLTAHENGFTLQPAGGGDRSATSQETRVISTAFELVEALTEWAYVMVPDLAVMDPKSPHAKATARAAVEVIQRGLRAREEPHVGEPPPREVVSTRRPSPLDPSSGGNMPHPLESGALSGTAHRVRPAKVDAGGTLDPGIARADVSDPPAAQPEG